MFSSMAAVVCAALVSGVALLTTDGPCPPLSPVNNFNLSAFAVGTWYEIAKYPNLWEGRGDCVSTVFSPKDGIHYYKVLDVTNHKRVTFDGYMKLSNPASTDGVVMSVSTAYLGSEHTNVIPINILMVDYTVGVGILFGCVHDPVRNIHHDTAWITSRLKKIDTRTQIKSFIRDSKIIDYNKLVWTNFTSDACLAIQ